MAEREISYSQLVAAIRDEARSNSDYEKGRGLFDYEYFLDISIPSTAKSVVKEKGSFRWYDMCCGRFKAGRQLAEGGWGVGSKVEVIGIDIDTPQPEDQVFFEGAGILTRGNVVDYPFSRKADLITCVNGLYLVNRYLGFSSVIKAIEHWYNDGLTTGGTIILMRESPLTGYEVPFSIEENLKTQLGDAVVISKPSPLPESNDEEAWLEYYGGRGPEQGCYVKIQKPNDSPIQIPK